MPITRGFTSRTSTKGEGHIHSEKWHRCIQHVKAKGKGYDPYAVCTFSIGYKESVNPEHQTPGPHASANTRRFKESAKRRREAKKMESYAAVLKFERDRVLKEHKCWGHACGGGGKSSGGAEGKKPRMQTLPHGKVSEAHAKELGLEPGSYRNIPGVGVMGLSNEQKRTGKAKAAGTTAEVAGNHADTYKGTPENKVKLHKLAAKNYNEAAKEYEKVGDTEGAAKAKAKAAHHRSKAK